MPGQERKAPEGPTHLAEEDNFYDQQPFLRVVRAAIEVDTERKTAHEEEKVIFSADQYRYGISYIVNQRYELYAAAPEDDSKLKTPEGLRDRNYLAAKRIRELPGSYPLFKYIDVSGPAKGRAKINFANNMFVIAQELDRNSALWDMYIHTQRQPSGYDYYGNWGTNNRTTREPTPTYEFWLRNQLADPTIQRSLLEEARARGKRWQRRSWDVRKRI